MWPGLLAFAERHLGLSDRVCSLYSFMSGIGSLIIPLIMGQTFDQHPLLLFVLEAGFVIISLALFVSACIWIHLDKWRKPQKPAGGHYHGDIIQHVR
jgi:fucose permease